MSAETNSIIRDAIVKIIKQQMPNVDLDALIVGTITAVYDTEGSDGYGTVDVMPANDDPELLNVRLKANFDGRGTIVFPKLGSEVVVETWQNSMEACVILFSHIDKIYEVVDTEIVSKISKITTGENFDDISETGEESSISRDGVSIKVEVKDSATTNAISVTKDETKLGDPNGTFEPMLLGDKVGQLFDDILSALASATTTVQGAPTPLNNAATFTSLRADIAALKSEINKLQ